MEEPLYTAEQIVIPPDLLGILKDFTKAAIRTQPGDILDWSSAYFNALAKGEVPPVKSRYEIVTDSCGGLSKGRLATLHKQLSLEQTITRENLREKWLAIGCHDNKLSEILSLGEMTESETVDWYKVLALSCTILEKNLTDAFRVLCEIVKKHPEGSDVRIPYQLFEDLYMFLAGIDGEIGDGQVKQALSWLQTESERFNGEIGPREFLHPNCPHLIAKI